MIIYNMRYRGPYEYDKFILNAFQLHNEVQRLLGNITNDELKQLKDDSKKLDNIINSYAGENSMLENIYYQKIALGLS